MNTLKKEIDKIFARYLSELPNNYNGNYDFNSDLKIGECGEVFLKNFLIYRGLSFLEYNKDNRYDLLMSYNSKKITYEIKTDILLSPKNDTGNIAIEFESRSKPSGISVTESDYFVYYIPKLNQMWNIKTQNLRELINNNKFKEVIGGDDGSFTKMYLIKRKKFMKNFKVYHL